MESKPQTLTGKAQLPGKAIFPPAWQPNELQRRFIEDLWLPEEEAKGPPGLVDNLTASGQDAEQHLQQG